MRKARDGIFSCSKKGDGNLEAVCLESGIQGTMVQIKIYDSERDILQCTGNYEYPLMFPRILAGGGGACWRAGADGIPSGAVWGRGAGIFCAVSVFPYLKRIPEPAAGYARVLCGFLEFRKDHGLHPGRAAAGIRAGGLGFFPVAGEAVWPALLHLYDSDAPALPGDDAVQLCRDQAAGDAGYASGGDFASGIRYVSGVLDLPLFYWHPEGNL